MERAWTLPIIYSALPQWPNHIMRREIWFSSLLHDIWLPCIRTPCPIKLAQCLPTIHSVLAKAGFPSQEALYASLLLARQNERTLPGPQIPMLMPITSGWTSAKLEPLRDRDRQHLFVTMSQEICLSASFSVEKVVKARKVSDSVTLKIQY